jgi:hypothetical protein
VKSLVPMKGSRPGMPKILARGPGAATYKKMEGGAG